jgi:hypothetical protein
MANQFAGISIRAEGLTPEVAMAYGGTEDEAVRKVKVIALQVLAAPGRDALRRR